MNSYFYYYPLEDKWIMFESFELLKDYNKSFRSVDIDDLYVFTEYDNADILFSECEYVQMMKTNEVGVDWEQYWSMRGSKLQYSPNREHLFGNRQWSMFPRNPLLWSAFIAAICMDDFGRNSVESFYLALIDSCAIENLCFSNMTKPLLYTEEYCRYYFLSYTLTIVPLFQSSPWSKMICRQYFAPNWSSSTSTSDVHILFFTLHPFHATMKTINF